MLPASFLHGQMIETLRGSAGWVGKRATTQLVRHIQRNPGVGPIQRLNNVDSSGSRVGNMIRELVVTTSNPANSNKLRMSSRVTQLSIGCGRRRPKRSSVL